MAILSHVHDHPWPSLRPVLTRCAVGAVVAVALAACTSSPPAPAPAPSAAPVPSTASALAAYDEFWRVSEQAFAAPTAKDWQPEVARVARGQALDGLMLEIRNYASIPAHLRGTIGRAPTVDPAVAPTSDRVAVLDCVDISASTLVADADGKVLDDQANQASRYRYRAEVVNDGTGRWLVEKAGPALGETC